MSNLRRRIQSLEAQFTEDSGLVPNTPKWLAHWTEWFNRRMRGEDPPGRALVQTGISNEVGWVRRWKVRKGQASSAAFHSSDIVDFRFPNFPVLN